MRADEKGIHLSKAEVWTLLAFTGEGAMHSVVHFRVGGGGKLAAGASDGKRSVHAQAKAEKGAAKGKWSLDREFLEIARSSLKEPEHALCIQPVGPNKDLPRAYIVDAETGDEITHSEWHRPAHEEKQLTLDQISEGIVLPDDRGYRGSWCAIDPFALGPLRRMSIAVEKQPITIFPPETEAQPLRFEVRSESAHWTGSILTERVLGPGEERDEPEANEGAPGTEANARQTRMDLADRTKASSDDGIVDDDYAGEDGDAPPKLATEKPKRQLVKPSQMKAPAE
jgi:hypothetical protein